MRLNAKLFGHPRLGSLGRGEIRLAAFGFYVRAASYSSEKGTDGTLTRDEISEFGRTLDFAPLINAGVAHATEDGFELTRWEPTPPRSRWHVLGHPDDGQPLLGIRTSWFVQSQRERRQLTPELRQSIILRDQGICGICGEPVPLADIHIDHIFPVSLGGLTEPDNLQVAHASCNLHKGARA